MNSYLCITLITCLLTIEFWSTIQNALVNNFIHQKIKNNLKSLLCPFNSVHGESYNSRMNGGL